MKTYRLLDSGNELKLEELAGIRMVRPCSHAFWKPSLSEGEWKKAQAIFTRTESGKGSWDFPKTQRGALPAEWELCVDELSCLIRLTDFGHVGIFPEHHKSETLKSLLASFASDKKPFRLLNLFAYTGVTSLMAAKAGASVVHVDASKKSVDWAQENAKRSHLSDLPIRWMVDDCKKFVDKELRRKSLYQGIILDPPSFGRGPQGEIWKIEEHLVPLLERLQGLMAEDFSFLQLSCHTPGFTPLTLKNLLSRGLPEAVKKRGHIESFEMSLYEESTKNHIPSGIAASFCCKL
ncbi:MAG: class I SAM-dependent methyltransferase [Oligoflexales bacterium]|nr:class I SAM-dependent methyltransferase [Oligoflexales bacterium]